MLEELVYKDSSDQYWFVIKHKPIGITLLEFAPEPVMSRNIFPEDLQNYKQATKKEIIKLKLKGIFIPIIGIGNPIDF